MSTGPEGFDDFRKGDEEPDAYIGGFAVYGGAPSDRKHLQDGDVDFATLDEELRKLLQQHDDETHTD